MQAPAKVRRIVVATVIAVVATSVHMEADIHEFGAIHVFWKTSATALDWWRAYANAFPVHLLWIVMFSWVLAYMLITVPRLRVTSLTAGILMTLPLALYLLIMALVAWRPAYWGSEPITIRSWLPLYLSLLFITVGGWQLGRVLGIRMRVFARPALAWLGVLATGVALAVWRLSAEGAGLIELDLSDGITLSAMWSFPAGLFLSWGLVHDQDRADLTAGPGVPRFHLGWRILGATIIAALLTLVKLTLELACWGGWARLSAEEWGESLVVQATEFYWHIGWIFMLSWLVVYVLLTLARRKGACSV